MKSFIGLIKKEHAYNASLNFVMLGFVIFVVSIIPIILHNYYSQTTIHGNRFIFIIITTGIVSMISIFSFFTSLNVNIRKKELWLHNTRSIITLILAKAVYQFISVLILCAVCFIGFFFVGEKIEGTFGQISMFYSYCLIIMLFLYPTLLVLTLFFYALSLELKRYIGKLSYILTFGLAIGFFSMNDNFSNELFQYGKVSTDWLLPYFPKFNEEIMFTTGDMYIGSEVASFLFIGSIFVIACFWIERVITR